MEESDMSKYEVSLDKQARNIEWGQEKCDKYDYAIAAFCGMAAGIIDALFVGMPGKSKLGKITDKSADEMVKKIANMLWKGDERSTVDGKFRKAPDTLEKSISYLEQSFPVNYDARYGKDLINSEAITQMSPKNHHLMSLAHSPDIVGLLFSIIDQFSDKASFFNNGKLIQLVPLNDARNKKITYIQGKNTESKIFCGICNWLGHLASDLCGSSSTRRVGKTGRGAGIPIPFYDLFLLMNFGNFDNKTFADIAIKIFEEGYDLRYGAAMAIPVLIEELSIKVIWALKKHYYEKKDWKDCIPTVRHADLRMMLLIGNASLCLVDGVDAIIRSGMNGGNLLTFMLHLNLIAWGRLILLVFRELKIRYGTVVSCAVSNFLSQVGFNDRYELKKYFERMETIDRTLNQALKEFVVRTENEYNNFNRDLNNSLNPTMGTAIQRSRASVTFARNQGVSKGRIIHNSDEMRSWLEGGKSNNGKK